MKPHKTIGVVAALAVAAFHCQEAIAQDNQNIRAMPARVSNLCGISLFCGRNVASTRWDGFQLLPQATLGLVPIPFTDRVAGRPSYRDAIGNFQASIGATFKWWWLDGWFDFHAQFLYGSAPALSDGSKTFTFGLTLGVGLVFSVLSVDLAFIDRRVLENADEVDNGAALLLNLDVTGLGVLIGTAAGGTGSR